MLDRLLSIFRRRSGRPGQAALSAGDMRAMVRGILSTRDDEIDCGQCFERLDRFVELVLDGKDAGEAMPLVRDHLDRCGDCREEFEALLVALRRIGER